MKISIVTLFPEAIEPYFAASILGRAQQAGLLAIDLIDLRAFGVGKHNITDDTLFGGGSGMLMRPEPIFSAVESIETGAQNRPIILLSPQGRVFDQTIAQELAQAPEIVLICGRYEGFDERIRSDLVTDEISIGDYVLTGGELGAMVVVDALARLIPGVLGKQDSAENDSHSTGLLEGAQYTKPATFRDMAVPEILRSGHAQKIDRWRRESALRRTWQRRPDLLLSAELDQADKQFLATLANEQSETHEKIA